MIFITDELNKFEKNIIELAENVGFKECKTIEAIDLFCGMSEKNDVLKEKDRYYAFIETPQYWSIRADGVNGAIYDNKTKMANIYFKNPIEKRMVSRVEWIDRNNTVYRIDYYNKYGYKYCSENVRGGNVISREFYDRNGDIKVLEQTGPKTYTTFGTRISPKSYRGFSEHYNRYGAIFCHTVFNKKGQKALRKFFDVTGREMIVENFVTGDILVRWQDKDWIFRSKTDFIAFFIRCAGLEDTAVYFNSLSYPFFASQALAPNGFRDALFWHEPVGDEIPGNMQIILHDQGTRAKRVFVSRRESYDRLIALGAPSDKVKQLGYIYSFVRENKHRPHILVCTNSENVGHLTELASLMPQMHFHVAAITEMSSKLMSAGQYDNVSLYPNVKMSVLDSLFEKCDFYLDINHEGEIVDAVHRAFLNNMLIVGYEETMHNAYYTADTNTFKESEYANMAEALNLTLAMPHLIDEALAMQKKAAVAADATDYMEILHL